MITNALTSRRFFSMLRSIAMVLVGKQSASKALRMQTRYSLNSITRKMIRKVV